jgi:hypothetical protein
MLDVLLCERGLLFSYVHVRVRPQRPLTADLLHGLLLALVGRRRASMEPLLL